MDCRVFGWLFDLIFYASCGALGLLQNSAQSNIPGGDFTPQYGVSKPSDTVHVKPFLLDQTPVTNGQFDRFIQLHREWNPETVSSLLADNKYLKHWSKKGDRLCPKNGTDNIPVTNVSWYAANEYCVSQGKRLPTVFEWEFAALASESKADASKDAQFLQRLLTWYSKPSRGEALSEVGKGDPNFWGIHDLHGLIWEWTADFNSVFVGGDNRRDAEELKNLFCGAGSTSSTDKANYAAYMRYALRNSLQARFTMETLGFRCARDK